MSDLQMSAKSHRKYPRKPINRSIGILCGGTYFIAEGLDVGEGGIGFSCEYAMSEEQNVVVTFQIPRGAMIIVPAVVKNQKQKDDKMVIGVAFVNLTFTHKRQIRYFVSSRNENVA